MKKILLILFVFLLAGRVMASTINQQVTVNIIIGDMQIYSPLEQGIYNSHKILINLSLSSEVKYLKYSDNGKSWKTLCRECISAEKERGFRKGKHEIEFWAVFEAGDIYKKVNFTIDSKKPKILKTNPRRGFVSGEFEVKFKETNPVLLELNYGNDLTGWRKETLNIGDDCYLDRNRYYCETDVSLDDYDGEEIEYWFFVEDIAKNNDTSRIRELEVDVTPPFIIDYTNYNVDYRYVIFNLSVIEDNLDMVYFIDSNDPKLRERFLCSRLKDGWCTKRKAFRKGSYNITVAVIDDVGQSFGVPASFVIDY